MALLALDQSLTRTGWCMLEGSRFRPETTKTGSFASPDPQAFGENLRQLVLYERPMFIVYEAPIAVIFSYGKRQLIAEQTMVTPNATQLYLHNIAGRIEQTALMQAIDCLAVAPRTWRKAVLGRGDLAKKAAKAAAKLYCQRIGAPFGNHDEAEAVCIGLFGLTSPEYRYRVAKSEFH
jgi:Holliday junction resolvasome RuvABC endonuclease subunit